MAKKSAKKLGSKQRKQWLKTLAPNVTKIEPGSLRVLIDTNAWYSTILYGGKPEQVLRLCKQNYQINSSQYLLDELFTLLKEIKAPYKWRNDLERILKRITISVEPPDFSGISRDPKDDPIIAAALSGECNFLLSNDKDLLELRSFNGLVILSPAVFLLIHAELCSQ